MPFVHVSGFPKEIKLVVSFRNYLNAANLASKYWITEVADIRNSNLKEFTIDFKSFDEALLAEEYMNSVPYCTSNGREYNLFAKIIDPQNNESNSSRNDYGRYPEERNHRGRSREYRNEGYDNSRYSNECARSRSPLEDPSKLDLELQLLRKKRLLVEEERRLILEQKKLEMIKEFGIDEYESGINRTREFEKEQRSRERVLRPQRAGGGGGRAERPLGHIPQFVLPCKIILKQMKNAIKRHAPDQHERNVLNKMIVSNLRRRFVIILENKPYMPSDAIAKLYRKVYPSTSDEELIGQTLQDVKASHWPKREKSQKTLEKMAKRKAEKLELKGKAMGEDGGDKPGTSTDELFYVDLTPDPIEKEKDVKPDIPVVVPDEPVVVPDEPVVVPDEPVVAGVVKKEAITDLPQVKTELNTSVVELDEDDWAANGVDWNDDDEESKDTQA